MNWISFCADSIGTTEPALTLLISVLTPYPLGIIYRHFLQNKSPEVQNVFFTICGLAIGYFNFGYDIIHSVISVISVYLILLFVGGTALSVALSFIFYMGYLLIGYICTETDQYDIIWTLPQCVLTMRLIALTFDVYDGQKDPKTLSADQKKTALSTTPSLLEIAGQTFFFGGFMVGPQFSMRRFQDMIHGKLCEDRSPNVSLKAGLLRGFAGISYMLLHQIGVAVLQLDGYLLTQDFDNLYLWKKLIIIGFWAKITLSKYLAMWLMAEGSCIVSGLTYNGKNENGAFMWDGCANIKIRKFEGSLLFTDVIQSFNINTNLWSAQYIYKRLKFLGNKYISQGVTLAFLAVWHGFHSGYYVCFLTEFFVVNMEKGMPSLLYRFRPINAIMNNNIVKFIWTLTKKIYLFCFTGYCLLPFVVLSPTKWLHIYKSLYFVGHIIYCGWPLAALLIAQFAPRMNRSDEKKK